MGQIIPFVTRVGSHADWSGEERARLTELAERYAAAGVRVEVIYGATDDGDPWCVVMDDAEEVLIHVARIGGVFVVHYAVDDALRQGVDLRSVLNERLAWDERPEVVVPFSRQAQSLLALIVAAGFFYETARPGDGSPPAAGAEPLDDHAGHTAGAADLPPPLAETALAGKALGAASAGALGFSAFEPARAVEWRSLAEDELPTRMDHGGAELVRGAPGGPIGPIANLEVSAPRAPDAPSPMVMAFNDHRRFAATATPDATSSNTFGASQLSTLRKPDGDPPAPQTTSLTPPEAPPTPQHPPVAATYWVEVDTDGDGRPDTRIEVPVEPKHEPLELAADHAAILAVGHAFPPPEIV